MPKTQVNCPNCRQPTVAEIDQLIDVNVDTNAKQRFLSGMFNIINCQLCGYQGALATPIPTELGLPQNEQERLIGGLINQVINKLPQEKRKGYLLQPQTTLTLQGLVERVLEADGITREMIQSQQLKLNLIRRLVNVSDEKVLEEIAKQEDESIDAEFFSLLSRLIDASQAGGDQESSNQLVELQKSLLPITTFGHELQVQSQEIEAAIADLRAAGKDLDRQKMLELVKNAPNETRLRALVSLGRPILDYSFFQLLSERIDRSRGDGRNRLIDLRTKLLEMTQEIDQQLEIHRQQTRLLIEEILNSEDVTQAMTQGLQAVDEIFLQEVNQLQAQARQQGDLEKSSNLQKMIDVIEAASKPPEEFALIEDYLEAVNDQDRKRFLQEHQEHITFEFMDMLANFTIQIQSGDDKDLAEHVIAANRMALRFTMEKNLRKS